MSKFWLNKEEQLLAIFFLLLIIGFMNVLSSTFVMANEDYGEPYYFLLKQLKAFVVGFIVFLLAYRLDYHWWRKGIGIFVLITLAGLVLVFFQPAVNGAHRWIYIGSLSLQPSELAKLVAIMLEASWLSVQSVKNDFALFQRGTFVIFLMTFLVERQPDGATAAIILGSAILLYLLSNAPTSDKLKITVGIIAIIVAIVFLQPYRLQRLEYFWDPFSAEDKEGYQILQSLAAFATGGFSGMGFGQGISKYHYLPEAHTDFAFAIFGQEVGFVGVSIVLALFLALLYVGLRVAISAVDLYGEFLAIGITLLFVGQGIINMMMVSGLLPVVGVPLPFISYGGSSLVVSMFACGMLLNIARISEQCREKLIQERERKAYVPYTKIHRVK